MFIESLDFRLGINSNSFHDWKKEGQGLTHASFLLPDKIFTLENRVETFLLNLKESRVSILGKIFLSLWSQFSEDWLFYFLDWLFLYRLSILRLLDFGLWFLIAGFFVKFFYHL